jgi:hypothetical protein
MLAKSSQSNSQAALDKEESGLACSRDERRLARQRSNPGPDEIASTGNGGGATIPVQDVTTPLG